MDQTQLLAELNKRIGDTDNFTFTSDEKTSALTEAINDEYSVTPKWDTSLTFTQGTYQYPKPTGVDSVQDIYIKPSGSTDYPEKIDSSFWEVIGSNIHFKAGSDIIPTGYTLYIKSKTKYDTSDTISEVSVQEYILKLAQLRLYQIMLNKKSMRFLKNDTSVNEIVTIKRELEQDVAKYRQRLPRAFEVS